MEQAQITNLMNRADELEVNARKLRAEAGAAKLDRINTGGIEEWLDVRFASSSGLTEEWALFAKQYKKALKKSLWGYDLIKWSRGHFFVSAFFLNKATANLVYVSISDVRFFRNKWYRDILVRTAEHDKDYTGGRNCSVSLKNIREIANLLTGVRR